MKTLRQRSSIRLKHKIPHLLFLLFVLLSFNRAGAVVVFLNQNLYKAGEKQVTCELNIKVPLYSLHFKQLENGFVASVKISYSYFTNSDTVAFEEFFLMSPPLTDTTHLEQALTGIHRVVIPDGKYYFYLKITDEFDTGNTSAIYTTLDAGFPGQLISFSDIELADTIFPGGNESIFGKNNYQVVPNVLNAFTVSNSSLFFYTEYYNAIRFLPDSQAYIRYFISTEGRKSGPEELIKTKVSDKNFIVGALPVAGLLPGKYTLHISLISLKNKTLASQKIDFTMLSPLYPTLMAGQNELLVLLQRYSTSQLLKSLEYMENLFFEKELYKYQLLKKSQDSVLMADFINDFWNNRYPANPLKAWNKYLSLVEESNRLFSTQMREGYLTDRGRVYVQYGPPNQVVDASDPSIAYPYQIWQYYKLNDNQSNQKFVFFNKTGALDEYELLHSTARGEPKNPNWKNVINKFNRNNNFQKGLFGDYLDKDFDQ